MIDTNTECPIPQDRLRDSDEMLTLVKSLAALAKRYGLPVVQAYVALDERLRGENAYEDPYDLSPRADESAKPAVREYRPEDLETANFRVDSTGWEARTDPDGTRYLANPEGDATELLEGPYAGEQHFQNDGALERELAKAGKRTMTPEEWESFTNRHADWMVKNLPLAGYRYYSSAGYYFQGAYGFYWASSPTGSYGYSVGLSSTQVYPVNSNGRAGGFSVRCLKE